MSEEERRLESLYKSALKELEGMATEMKADIRKKYSKLIPALALIACLLIFVRLMPISLALATNSTSTGLMKGYMAIGMGLSVGLAALGAGFAIAAVGAATVSATVEKPESFTRGFIIVTLGEALAIYGLIVSILIWISF